MLLTKPKVQSLTYQTVSPYFSRTLGIITRMKKNISFSTIFGILFAIIGLVIGLLISNTTINDDYKYFYLYSVFAGFITAKLFAKYLIEKKSKFTNIRLITTSILTGLLSHWLCWYIIILELNFRYWILDEHFFSPPTDPILGVFGVFALALWSWLFFGWATILGGILSIYTTKWIYK